MTERTFIDLNNPIVLPAKNTKGLYTALKLSEVLKLKSPKFQVEGIFHDCSLIALCSDPGIGKTLLSLSLAYAIASGKDFLGKYKTRKGKVLFISAEGFSGLKNRCRALEQVYGEIDPDNILFIPEATELKDPAQLKRLVDTLNEIGFWPDLIVIDTLARCMPGSDENSTKEFGIFIKSLDRLRFTTGASILLVHHMTKAGKKGNRKERGSGVLLGAVDTMIHLEKDKGFITASCKKQKDAPHFAPMHFDLFDVPLGNDEVCSVIKLINDAFKIRPSIKEVIKPDALQALNALTNFPDGVSFSTWRDSSKFPYEKKFTRAKEYLEEQELVYKKGHKQGAKYFLTEEGLKLTDTTDNVRTISNKVRTDTNNSL